MEFEFLSENKRHRVTLEKKDDRIVVRRGSQSWEMDLREITPNIISLLVDGRAYLAYLAGDKNKTFIQISGQTFVFEKPGDEDRRTERGDDRSEKDKSMVRAPMPGKVIKIHVSEKEEVRKNQTLAIVEAMKMENEIKSPMEAVVKKIYAAPGDLVDSDKPLIELAPKA
ncbi:MAG: biotin/lipoyl-containing protein [Acidobacteriota bacterium]